MLKVKRVPVEFRAFEGQRLVGCSDCNDTGQYMIGKYKRACSTCHGTGQSIFRDGIPSDWHKKVVMETHYDKEYVFRWVQRPDWATRFEEEPEAEKVFAAILDECKTNRWYKYNYTIDEVPD